MAARRAQTKRKKRTARATSNVFAMFSEQQIQEFKEAFSLIDDNHDQKIDMDDLSKMFDSLGQNPGPGELEKMMDEAPTELNFTMFLTLFGDKMTGTDPEDVIKNAFACFDPNSTGKINDERLRELLTTMGDRFTEAEVEEMYKYAPIDSSGGFDYREYTSILKNGSRTDTA
uniref:Myosin regulatory light chain n=1 Tax=Choanoeca flexa TaxID=2572930 RepID=A0A513ZS35_9EUKA|nr:myosin regulatory light chain [Choanoeca flexa]|eukprot:TRINITY_DN6526_c0_g1_i1.p1 TRINITY_DN6526_c0_g1~~TRINITY_DN6526_c0_g1_i1.p1  ORF type:complete len:172 (+),score=41.68 TRINITY_DN6526_c0_g1_i1:107-622(+)